MSEKSKVLNTAEIKRMVANGTLVTQEDVSDFLKQVTGEVLESILNGELDGHLDYERYDRKNKKTSNSRNGSSRKTVKTQSGKVSVSVPRDRQNEFEPIVLPKGERKLAFLEDQVIALYSKGMSTRDISEIIEKSYAYKLSPESVSKITDRVHEDRAKWHNRPLERCYAAIFIDALFAKACVEGSVINAIVYVIIGVRLDGSKDCLGFWIGEQSESAKYWLMVLNELRNRGVEDVLFVCSDNLSGISEAISSCFPEAKLQKCIVHQVRNSLKNVSYKDRKELVVDLKEIYKAPTEAAGFEGLEKLEKKWNDKYPHIAKSWRTNWDELSVYFTYSPEIRRLIYTTNAIESVNRGIRRRIKTRSLFPSHEALGKVVYLSLKEIAGKWKGPIPNWGLILSQLRVHFGERLEPYLKEMN